MKRILLMLITTILLLTNTAVIVLAANSAPVITGHVLTVFSDETVYEALIALEKDFPTGMKWNNSNRYENGDYGCHGFARMITDAVFGDKPMIRHENSTDVKVGDLVRVNNDKHTVVVLTVTDTKITTVEGNVNGKIVWHREYTPTDFRKAITYILTRDMDAPDTANEIIETPEIEPITEASTAPTVITPATNLTTTTDNNATGGVYVIKNESYIGEKGLRMSVQVVLDGKRIGHSSGTYSANRRTSISGIEITYNADGSVNVTYNGTPYHVAPGENITFSK